MTDDSQYTNLEKNRLEKMERLRQAGMEPYPALSNRTHTSQQAIVAFEASEGKESAEEIHATLVGRIRSTRLMGKLAFAHIEDGFGQIQLFIRLNEVGEENLDLFKKEFDLGDFVQASGVLFRTKSGEVSLRVDEFKMLAKAITPLPAAKDEEVTK